MRIRNVLLPVLGACAFVACSAASAEAPTTAARSGRDRPEVSAPMISFGHETARAAAEVQAWNVAVWNDTVWHAEIARQLDVIDAELDAYAARAAAASERTPDRLPAVGRTASPQPALSGATGSCGGATNGADRFIARESGGSPSVYNTGGSGAWGCYQIMPGTWSGSCSDLGSHGSASADAQAACASRLPLSAWGG